MPAIVAEIERCYAMHGGVYRKCSAIYSIRMIYFKNLVKIMNCLTNLMTQDGILKMLTILTKPVSTFDY